MYVGENMILTITMNPSVDISYPLGKLVINDVNRIANVKKTAGGKGLNVTRGIHASSVPVIATGVLGGTTGEYIKKELDKDGISYHFYNITQESRNCIAILHEGNQTEILESGPSLTEKDVDGFLQHYQSLLKKCKAITISGSLPIGFPINFYATLIAVANQHNIPVLLDSSGDMLLAALTSATKPYLIKPNKDELQHIINQTIDPQSINSLIQATAHPLLDGVQFVIVSLGKDGAFARYHDHCYRIFIPKIEVINPVGSGDVTLGGLAVSIYKNEDITTMLKRAMVMGMLNAMEAQTGFVNLQNYDTYFKKVIVEKLN